MRSVEFYNYFLANRLVQYNLARIFEPIIISISNTYGDDLLIINVKLKYVSLFLSILKKHTAISMDALMDIWGIDFPSKKKRFCVNYLLTNISDGNRLIVRVHLSAEDTIRSATALYSSAGWLERETFDMFGIIFKDNLDLRRILTDYGFEGFPLRKDFPLTGFYELRFDLETKRIKFESVELTQEFRTFYFQKPWK